MRLGLLADIHESVDRLRAAVAELRARNVDSFVMLGDFLENGDRADETVALLSDLPGVGVWGNHDFGLCDETDASVRDRFPASVLEYCARLQPSVVLEGIRFQHIDPHLDPSNHEDLWAFPTASERIAGLARCAQSLNFTGHLHSWGIWTPDGPVAWRGDETFRYRTGQRYLTTIHAVVEGWCALFDSERETLEPIALP